MSVIQMHRLHYESFLDPGLIILRLKDYHQYIDLEDVKQRNEGNDTKDCVIRRMIGG